LIKEQEDKKATETDKKEESEVTQWNLDIIYIH
jgi:hypothetical protein